MQDHASLSVVSLNNSPDLDPLPGKIIHCHWILKTKHLLAGTFRN
jgi:hypothetical protein